jgi:hypothetical protein
MEMILKVTIPDSDVPYATENAPGPGGDLAEWLAQFFRENDRSHLRDLGLGQLSIEILEVSY